VSAAPTRAQACALALAAAFGYGAVGVLVSRTAATGMGLPAILTWRFGLAALVLAPFVSRRLAAVPARALGVGLALGAAGFSLQSYLYLTAVAELGAGTAAVLLYFYPCLVMLMDWWAARQAPSKLRIVVLLVATAGCVVTAAAGGGTSAALSPGRLLLGLSPAAAYALYLVAGNKLMHGVDALSSTLCVCAGAAATFAVTAVLRGEALAPPSGQAVALVVALALVSTVLPLASIFAAMRRLGPTTTSLLSTTEPVFALLLGHLLLGETVTLLQIGGGALVVGGASLLALEPFLAARPQAATDAA
jgi:drug/metabolite transporter (DMT)-like permease